MREKKQQLHEQLADSFLHPTDLSASVAASEEGHLGFCHSLEVASDVTCYSPCMGSDPMALPNCRSLGSIWHRELGGH